MNSSIAIKVENLSKTFKIPHEKVTTLKGAFVGALKKKTFEEFKALDGVSFEVKKGEFFGIIGRNGSGKSTLLKILAGIYQADCGRIQVNGRISPFLELGIGFNPELSGRDNIYLNASVLGLTKKQIDKKFDEIVAFSELSRFIDQKLKNYSSGMQVRLEFSVSIHANRDILLMDEVLAVGDTNFQYKCLSEFTRYKNLGKTVILVTHDMLTAQKYCDRLMLLRNGVVKSIGNPGEVGTEYIYQNMDDEERRILKEEETRREKEGKIIEKNKDKKKDKTLEKRINGAVVVEKVAKIKKVSFFDQNNVEKNVFKRGDKIRISISISFFKKVNNPNFGIIIKNFESKPIFVTNTDFNRIKTGFFHNETISVNFTFINLLSNGSYSVTTAIANSIAIQIYDWLEDVAKFTVIGNYDSGGVADFDHKIEINKYAPGNN